MAKLITELVQGGVIWGVGMALMEKTVFDPRTGRIVTRNLADYLVQHPDDHSGSFKCQELRS